MATELSGSLAKFLKTAKDKWADVQKQAAAGQLGFSQVPVGFYVTRLTGAILKESSKGMPMVHFSFAVMDGDEEGHVVNKYDNLAASERSLEFLGDTLMRLGVDVSDFDLSDLPQMLRALRRQAPMVRVQVKKSGEYTNVYVDRLVDEDESDDDDDDTPAPPARQRTQAGTAARDAESTPTKRGPGRPRKTAAAVDDEDGDGDAAETPAVKRGPGRPRKTAEPTPAAASRTKTPTHAPAPAPPPPIVEDEDDEDEDEDDEDDEVAEGDEEEVELTIGAAVTFQRAGKTLAGEVVDLDEDTETATIRVGKKEYPVSINDIELDED